MSEIKVFGGRFVTTADPPQSGRTSTVYRACDMATSGAPVAVKVLRGVAADTELLQELFLRERESLTALKHPNIVELVEAGVDPASGDHYLVLEWLETDLQQHLAAQSPADWDAFAGQYLIPLLEALALAHSRNIVHRDINPRNVRLGAGGVPKLADFGIAKLLDSLRLGVTVAHHVTRPFAPPNRSATEPKRDDLYSIGTTTIACLLPPGQELSEDARGCLRSLDLDPRVRDYLARLISDDVQKRPFDASVALAELRRIQAERAVRLAPQLRLFLSIPYGRQQELMVQLGCRTLPSLQQAILADLSHGASISPLRGRAEVESLAFSFFGKERSYRVAVDSTSFDRLVVLRATVPFSQADLQRLVEEALPVNARFSFDAPSSRLASKAAVDELCAQVAEFAAQRELKQRLKQELALFGKWEDILTAKHDLETLREAPIHYQSFRESDGRVTFRCDAPPQADLEEPNRVVRQGNRVVLRGTVAAVTGRDVVFRVSDGDATDLPRQGALTVDSTGSKTSLRREQKALSDIRCELSVRPDLRQLLVFPDQARTPHPVGALALFQPDLDESKQAALRAVLGSEDVVSVQGPPGTGKTTLTAEIVAELLARDPRARILLTGQTNTAVDNALAAITRLREGLDIVRVGTKLSPGVLPYSIDSRLEAWAREVRARCREFMDGFTARAGIAPIDRAFVEKLCELKAARDLASRSPDGGRVGELEAALAALAGLPSGQPVEPGELDQVVEARLGAPDSPLRAFARLQAVQSKWLLQFGKTPDFAAELLASANIVAGTCVGIVAADRDADLAFDLVVIDEASKATPTEALVPMSRGRRWVLLGDPKQLPPFFDDQLEREGMLRRYNLSRSDLTTTLMDHFIQHLPDACSFELTIQHRMIQPIGDLVSECFYGGRLATARADAGHPVLAEVLRRPVTWYSTSGLGERRRERDRAGRQSDDSKLNEEEARRICAWLQRLETAAGRAGAELEVGVLSGYLAQVERLNGLLGPANRQSWRALRIEVNTVHAFQGRQVDVVVYSVTRSNARRQLGFLKSRNHLNVALSRGKDALVIFGDADHCRRCGQLDNPFRDVLTHISRHSEACALEILR